jgi:HD superfamily phosphohydrolase
MSFIHSSTSFILHHISHFPYSHTISQSKFASVEFKALSEKDKAKWEKLAAADKERYLAEMETYSPPAGY